MKIPFTEDKVRLLARVDAVVSWIAAPAGLLDPSGVALALGLEESGPVPVFLCAAIVLLSGAVAWYAAGSVRTRAALLRGLWLEKAVLGASLTAAHLAGWVPPAGMGLNVLVNLAWVPVYMYADAALRGRPPLEVRSQE